MGFWICVLLWLFAKETILKAIWICLKSCVQSATDDEKEEDEAHSKDFFKELLIRPLTDMYDKAGDELDDHNPFDPDVYDENRYEEEVRFTKESPMKMLTHRK